MSDTGQGIAPEFLPYIFDRFREADDRQRALDAGYNLHISKPVEPAELDAAVARLAGRS